MNNTSALAAMGLTIPSPSYLFGAILFSAIGYAAYRYGKRNELMHPRWIGVALMLFPYAISRTWMLYLIGAALCAALYVFRS
jgi:hypothetical protein